MTQLLNFPPRVKVGKSIADCVGKKLKKKASDVLEKAAQLIEDECEDELCEEYDDEDEDEELLTFADRVREGYEW